MIASRGLVFAQLNPQKNGWNTPLDENKRGMDQHGSTFLHVDPERFPLSDSELPLAESMDFHGFSCT